MTFRRCVYCLQMLWFIKTEIWCEDVHWSFHKEMPCASQASTNFSEVSAHLQSQLSVLLLATQSCCFPEGLRANIQQMVCLPQHCCPNDQKCPQSQLFISLATLECSRAEKRGRKKKSKQNTLEKRKD